MTTLIIGAAGKTGRRVAEQLTSLGQPIRPVSRRTSPSFDWDDETTWAHAIAGTTAAYITYHPDLALPGADERIGAFARTAVEHGCRRLVLLSGRGEDGALRAEEALAASGAAWTVVRSAFFTQNFTEGVWAEGLRHGALVMIDGSSPEPFVDADDVASVAVAALTESGHEGVVHEVTGPCLATFQEIVADIARISGREIEYRELAADDFAIELQHAGLSSDEAGGLAALFTEVLDGRNAHTTSTVEDVLGRAPRGPLEALTIEYAR